MHTNDLFPIDKTKIMGYYYKGENKIQFERNILWNIKPQKCLSVRECECTSIVYVTYGIGTEHCNIQRRQRRLASKEMKIVNCNYRHSNKTLQIFVYNLTIHEPETRMCTAFYLKRNSVFFFLLTFIVYFVVEQVFLCCTFSYWYSFRFFFLKQFLIFFPTFRFSFIACY